MKMYVGTYSDEVLLKVLKDNELKRFGRVISTDQQIQDKLKNGEGGAMAMTFFFVNSHHEAYKMARQMDLKNFCMVCDKMYEKGVDY